MKTNLLSQVESDVQKVIEEFVKAGWQQIDDGWIEKTLNGEAISLCCYPELLFYSDQEGYMQTIWIACQIEIPTVTQDKFDQVITLLLQEIKKLSLKPFTDEDAPYHHFTYPEIHKGWQATKFYLNPDYPEGWWCNHTLDD